MKKHIIGPGKVGTALGNYLGVTPNKDIEKAKEADIIFITTPDQAIHEVYHLLKGSGKIFCHMSGLLTSDVFTEDIGFSVHPMAAVTKETNLQKVRFTIEGHAEKLHIIKSLFPNNKEIKKEAKPLYHASAVIASNFLVGIYNIAENLLKEVGFDEDTSILIELIESTLNNIKEKGSINALTGPVERMDIKTIKTHLNDLPIEYEKVYLSLSKYLVKIAEIKNKSNNYHQLLQLFHEQD